MGAIYPGGDVAAEDDGGRGLEHAQKAVYQVSNRFTKINSRQAGQPHFPPADDVAPANGPVVTYRMSPEEIAAKYGPPVPRTETRRQKLSRENLIELLRTRTVGQVAERYCVPQKLVFELCDRFGLELDDKNRLVSGGDNEMAHGDKMRRARAALPREEFERLYKQGLSDYEIADASGVAYHHVVRFKKEYGFTGLAGRGNKNPYKKENDNVSICEYVNEAEGCTEEPEAIALFGSEGEIQVEQAAGQAERKMTIAQALELKEELIEEVDSTENIMTPDAALAPRLKQLLEAHIKECATTVQAIENAFETVEISI